MRLDSLNLSEFLPMWMQDDKTAQAFTLAVQNQLYKVIGNIASLNIYTGIDTQTEAVLDELGMQFNIPEYDSDLPIQAKRNLIKTAIATHRKRGTVAAVKQVVTDIFGDARLEEWFEYGGKPYHFKVYANDVNTTAEQAILFGSIVSSQNVRSVLEAIIIKLTFENTIYVGATVQMADNISISATSDIDISVLNIGSVVQIADFVTISSDNEVI